MRHDSETVRLGYEATIDRLIRQAASVGTLEWRGDCMYEAFRLILDLAEQHPHKTVSQEALLANARPFEVWMLGRKSDR